VDLTLTDEQELIRDSVARLLAKRSGPEQVRAAEATGFDPELWGALVAVGLPAMALPEDVGGGGSTLAGLGIAVEACGAALASAPVVEVAVAGRALARHGRAEEAARVAAGAVVVVAPRPAADGVATLVPGAGAAEGAVVLHRGHLVLAPHDPGAPVPRALSALGAADVAVDHDLVVLAAEPDAEAAHTRLADEWRSLTAAWLVGLAQHSLDLAVRYATERHQFGVPIGSFQALQHRMADRATDVEGARLLARKALWALDGGEPEAAAHPAMAFARAAEVAQRTASDALHVHGGYGFMEEYDVQLAFRRAKAVRLLVGDPHDDLAAVTDRCFGPVGAPLPDAASVVLGPVDPARRPARPGPRAWTSASPRRWRPSGPRPGPSWAATSPTR